METALWSTLSALLGALVGGGISWFLQRQQFQNQLRILQEQNKVEFMAEETARHFLRRPFDGQRDFIGARRPGDVAGLHDHPNINCRP